MRLFRLTLECSLCLAVFATAGCGRKSNGQVIGESLAQSPSPSGVSTAVQSQGSSQPPGQTPQSQTKQRPTLDLSRLENSVRPAVFWITIFDSSGKLLRTQTAFFISADGRFTTTAHAIEDGVNAVAKMADGEIHNVDGVLASSATLDLAILQADVKRVPFLALNKTANVEVVGIVISGGDKATARPAKSVGSLLDRITADAKPRWPETAQTVSTRTPVPRPTPKPRLVYAPAPAFPRDAHVRPGVAWSGRFSLSFDSRGNVTKVQIVRSTGNEALDRAAISTLRQWKSAPGGDWAATVPVTFQTR